MFITSLITARHKSLSLARSIPSMPLHPLPGDPSLIYTWAFQVVSFPQVSPTKSLYGLLLSSICATCPVHLYLLVVIIRMTFGEEYRSLSSSLCSFLHSAVSSSLLGPNILLSTLLSNTFSLLSTLNVSDHVSDPYKATTLN